MPGNSQLPGPSGHSQPDHETRDLSSWAKDRDSQPPRRHYYAARHPAQTVAAACRFVQGDCWENGHHEHLGPLCFFSSLLLSRQSLSFCPLSLPSSVFGIFLSFSSASPLPSFLQPAMLCPPSTPHFPSLSHLSQFPHPLLSLSAMSLLRGLTHTQSHLGSSQSAADD